MPSATGILKSYCHLRLISASDRLDLPTVPASSHGTFKAVVKERVDSRDALRIEWHTERSRYVGGCMFCPPRKSVVQDRYILWIDAATKLPLQQISPNGSVKRYGPSR